MMNWNIMLQSLSGANQKADGCKNVRRHLLSKGQTIVDAIMQKKFNIDNHTIEELTPKEIKRRVSAFAQIALDHLRKKKQSATHKGFIAFYYMFSRPNPSLSDYKSLINIFRWASGIPIDFCLRGWVMKVAVADEDITISKLWLRT